MTTKTKAKKAPAVKPETHAIAEQVEAIADSLRPLYHLNDIANHLGGISYALDRMAESAAMQIIVTHGSDADRERIVKYLKRKHHKAFED